MSPLFARFNLYDKKNSTKMFQKVGRLSKGIEYGVWIILVMKDSSCDFLNRRPTADSHQNVSTFSSLNATQKL